MSKVYVSLIGGLGNQLFQYAAGLAVARSSGRTLCLLPPTQNIHSTEDYRAIMTKGIPTDSIDRQVIPVATPSDAFSVWSPELPGYEGFPSILLSGYFQYLPAIFHEVIHICIDLLVLFQDLRNHLRSKYGITDEKRVAFAHIRRGDYILKEAEGHWNLPLSYYVDNLQRINATRVLLLSDDPDWCRGQPLPPHVEVIDEPTEFASLALMSLCGAGGIIANSTFSWWGAMMSLVAHQNQGTFIYPSRWYKNVTPTLFTGTWLQGEA